MKNIMLSNYCCWDDSKSAEKLLKEHPDFDLTEDNGTYFRLAIKYKNLKVLNSLLGYYEKTVLKGKEFKDYTTEDSILRKKLQEILKDAVESFDISKEIEEVLSGYTSSDSDKKPDNSADDEDSDDSQNLRSEYNDSDSDFSYNENNNYYEDIEPIGDTIDVH